MTDEDCRADVGNLGGKPTRRSDTESGARIPFLGTPILRPVKVKIALRPGLSANALPYFHFRTYLRHGILRDLDGQEMAGFAVTFNGWS